MDIDSTIDNICNEIKNGKNKNNSDSLQDQQTTKKRGAINKGLTQQLKKEFKEDRKQFRNIKQPDNFSGDLIEHCSGDVVNLDNIKEFKEAYQLTCDSILNQFAADNADLVKKHPYNWYKKLLLEIKQNVPPVSYKDIDKLIVIWDILSNLLDSIGLYITFETFEKMTKVYKYQLENMGKVNPKYIEFVKKINKDCDSSLINELAYNPYNQTNKIFIAKVHGIIEKTETKTIEVNHNIKNYDNIAAYRLQDQQQRQQ